MRWVRELVKLARSVCRREVSKIHTSIPAQVVSYDATKNTASIQLCVKIIRNDDPDSDGSEFPVLEDIPVMFAGSGNVFLTVPVKKDSYGVYEVAEDDINDWLSKGGIVSPTSVDRFNPDTGFFKPCSPWMFDSSFGEISTDRVSVRTRDGLTEISVLENGNVEINVPTGKTVAVNGSADAAALASIVDDYFTKLDTLFRTTWVPVPTDGGAALKAAYTGSVIIPPLTSASKVLKIES